MGMERTSGKEGGRRTEEHLCFVRWWLVVVRWEWGWRKGRLRVDAARMTFSSPSSFRESRK